MSEALCTSQQSWGAHLSKLLTCSIDSYIQASHQGLLVKCFLGNSASYLEVAVQVTQVHCLQAEAVSLPSAGVHRAVPWDPPHELVRVFS